MLRAALAALVLPACMLSLAWDDVPTATVTPVVADPSYDEAAWTIEVATAVGLWNEALVARGCPKAFELGDGGHSITIVAAEDWAHGGLSGWETGDGLQSAGRIEIRNRGSAEDHIDDLTHELGHALGLGHSDNSLGSSIMGFPANGDRLYARDVDAAACVLGCGSCDLEDHFVGGAGEDGG